MRNTIKAARHLAQAGDERLKLIALRDPDMIRDVALALVDAHLRERPAEPLGTGRAVPPHGSGP